MISRPCRFVLLSAIAVSMLACGPSGGVRTTSPVAPSASPHIDPSPDGEPGASISITQTDTEWGRIWDAVPAGFPRFPGSAPAGDASATPSSARYTVSGSDPEEIAAWLQAGMETATFSTDVSGPLEDGGFTLESVGDAGCRIQTSVAPLGGMTFVTVFSGVDCPIQ
jgi:hypothetical protein